MGKTRSVDDKLSSAIIANFIAMLFNEELKGTEFYKAKLKVTSKPYMDQLLKLEKKEYNKLCDSEIGDDMLQPIASSFFDYIKDVGSGGLSEFLKDHPLMIARKLDHKRLNGLACKIIKEHNNKKQ